jgi:hypothetical protein
MKKCIICKKPYIKSEQKILDEINDVKFLICSFGLGMLIYFIFVK